MFDINNKSEEEGTTPFSLALLRPGILQLIFRKLDFFSLGNLALSSKDFSDMVLKYVLMESSLPYMFTCLKRDLLLAGNNALYVLRGKTEFLQIVPHLMEQNFRQLGVLMKRTTMLKQSKERMTMALSLISRILPVRGTGSNEDLMTGLATYFHAFVKGWSCFECEYAAEIFSSIFKKEVTFVLEDSYVLGSQPELEICLRNFLKAFFITTVDTDSRLFWIHIMVKIFVPLFEPKKIAKIFPLATSPSKDSLAMFGIQWKDNIEAVPACAKVALHRYNDLVQSLLILQCATKGDLMNIFSLVFQVPKKWIPENIASFLIVAGVKNIRSYLAYMVEETIQRISSNEKKCIKKEDFTDLGDIMFGLFVMQSRFQRSMGAIYHRLDEVVALLPKTMRKPFFQSLWSAISKEIEDINEAEDFWSEDSYGHICKVLSSLGVRLLSKGYQNKCEGPRLISSIEE